jgi:hypothetical protein
MQPLVFLIICLTVLSGTGIARAGDVYEYRVRLLVLKDFEQSANFKYDFSDHMAGNEYSRSHAFKESYNFGLDADILDSHIFTSSLKGGIIYEQDINSGLGLTTSGKKLTYQYRFSGIGLDKSSTPFSLLSFRDLTSQESTYSQPYSTDSTSNEFSISIENSLLKSKFNFARTTLDNKGSGYDSSSVSYTYSYGAEHKYKDISTTSLSLSFSDQTWKGGGSAGEKSTTNQVTFANSLTMGPQNKYSLLTLFQWKDSVIDNIPQRYINFNETLQARFGKALTLEANYNFSKNSYIDYYGQTEVDTRNGGEATLRHWLFKSLNTTLRGKVSSEEKTDGTEDRYLASGRIQYFKQADVRR